MLDAATPGVTPVETMVQHCLLSPADFRRVPWRTGTGRTTEIASHPPGATHDAFDWRVGIGEVIKEGPFPHLPGIERTIVVLGGAGLRLDGGRHQALLAARYEPYTLSGDDAVHCTLIEGSVREFELLLRRGRCRGSVIVLQGEGVRPPRARFTLCYAATGACECLLAGHAPLTLATDHALLVEDAAAATSIAVNPLTADAVALVTAVDLSP
jgi:environmental stress-induced protein Ves